MTPSLPYGFARRHGLLLHGGPDGLALAMTGSPARQALAEARRVAGAPLRLETLDAAAFDRLLSETYGSAALADTGGLAALADDLPSAADLLDNADEAPVIRLINGLIAEAARIGASDIHVEPHDGALVVRMRADGQLAERHRLPAQAAAQIVSRIKVMARLDIAERRLPQDGRMSLALAGTLLDVRVSTLPARGGERVVLRLLDKANAGRALADLGMPPALAAAFEAGLAEPNGLVLVTGPTGSGKTTTLYAGLKQLNDGSRNILTVEDPVEYAVDGVGQTQINTAVGLSFAAGLRAMLRQDPDVVMVGEIRDAETAEIAVQAALTGHLVLSSVHTNDAAGAITRLRDFGVEPFLLAATLRLVVAQRLLRRLCHCAAPRPAGAAEAAALGLGPGAIVHEPAGCADCGHGGWQGRIGLFEAIRISGPVRTLIADGADDARIAEAAFAEGSTLADAARAAVLAGTTSVAEAVRVLRSRDG
jgi:general secretion pathway protein E